MSGLPVGRRTFFNRNFFLIFSDGWAEVRANFSDDIPV